MALALYMDEWWIVLEGDNHCQNFFALAFWFAHRTQGRNLGQLLEATDPAHHQVHRVIEAHPKGGTWTEHQQWMEGT